MDYSDIEHGIRDILMLLWNIQDPITGYTIADAIDRECRRLDPKNIYKFKFAAVMYGPPCYIVNALSRLDDFELFEALATSISLLADNLEIVFDEYRYREKRIDILLPLIYMTSPEYDDYGSPLDFVLSRYYENDTFGVRVFRDIAMSLSPKDLAAQMNVYPKIRILVNLDLDAKSDPLEASSDPLEASSCGPIQSPIIGQDRCDPFSLFSEPLPGFKIEKRPEPSLVLDDSTDFPPLGVSPQKRRRT